MQRRGLALLSMSGCSVHAHIHFTTGAICQDSAELHSAPGWSRQPIEQPLTYDDNIFNTIPFLRKAYIYRYKYKYMDTRARATNV